MKPSRVLFFFMLLASGLQARHAKGPALQENVIAWPARDSGDMRLRFETGKALRIARLPYWDSLLADVRISGSAELEYEVLYQLSNVNLNILHKPGVAGTLLEDAVKLAEAREHLPQLITSLQKLVSYHLYVSNTVHAIELCYKGLHVAEALHDKIAMAGFYTYLARIYRSQADRQKALAMELRCLALYRELDRHYDIAGCLLNIGSLYGDMGRVDKKAEYYLATAKYAAEFSQSMAGCEINNSIATAYRIRKQYARAEPYLRTALHDSRLINCKSCEVSTLLTISMNHLEQQQYARAKATALEALALAQSIGFRAQLPELYGTLAYVYEKAGEPARALRYIRLYNAVRDSMTNEQTLKRVMEKEFAYNLGKKVSENRVLQQQNEIQSLRLEEHRHLIAGLACIALLVLVIAFLLLRQNRLKAVQRSMQLEQKLLRSQMNPHFIFNSLQAIQHFILKQDVKQAVKYLSSFSSVTRSVLESSRTDLIPLQKEIALLEDYLALQKLRFGTRFDYAVTVNDPAGEAASVQIPPVLAQPFIENAVEHGMHGIEEGGKIDVQYSIYPGCLCIDVTDNGYGMQDNGRQGADHRSMAMSITRERIALINTKEKRPATLAISHAFPSEPERKGVAVRIVLPVKTSGATHHKPAVSEQN